MRLVRGRSTPAIRAICYPCLCLCFEFVQITRTTPRRRTILHLSQIRLTDARTFTALRLSHNPSALQIPRRQFHDHPIPDEHPDEVPFLPAPDVRRDAMAPLDLDLVQP